MIAGYPKKANLKDGTEIEIRPMAEGDGERLLAFFRALPEEDRLFLKEDVTDPAVIRRWEEGLDYERTFPLVALRGNEIVGDATLHMQRIGWFRNLGEIRTVVAKNLQRKGLGTLLAREIFHYAQRKGLHKIQALIIEEQVGAAKAFEKIGFRKAAVLPHYVTDLKGKKHNLVVMINDVEELWRQVEDMILDSEFSMEY